MIVLIRATVMTVGIDGRNEVLKELPIQLVKMKTGAEAVCSLKNKKVDSVISNWNLDDMEDGRFLKKLKAIKPDIPTIVFVKAGDSRQEIAARSIGSSAVLTDQASDELFRKTVSNVLGLENVVAIKSISTAAKKIVKTEKL